MYTCGIQWGMLGSRACLNILLLGLGEGVKPSMQTSQILNSTISSVEPRLQPGSNNASIGSILGKLCDREDIGFGVPRDRLCGLGSLIEQGKAAPTGQGG